MSKEEIKLAIQALEDERSELLDAEDNIANRLIKLHSKIHALEQELKKPEPADS